jgi:ribonuclease HI
MKSGQAKPPAQDVKKSLTIFFDGAGCRPNGDGSGFAWLCRDTGQKYVERMKGLTNNQAEYKAFLAALQSVPDGCAVEMFSDSQLICSQFAGTWRTKDSDLQILLALAHELIRDKHLTVQLQWIPRSRNLAGKLI